MRIKLVSIDPFQPPLKLEIDELPAVIGKSQKADVQLRDRCVADLHCELREQSGEVNVRHLRSEIGILVNNKPVDSAMLIRGDILTIGIRALRVAYVADAKVAEPALKGAEGEDIQVIS